MSSYKREALGLLKGRGAAKAVVAFSGGNDEGGVDWIALFDAKGERTEVDPYGHPEEEWTPDEGRVPRELTQAQKDDNRLVAALAAPVFERYGSFAGPFSVSGKVTFDVKAGTVEMTGEISHESYDEVYESL